MRKLLYTLLLLTKVTVAHAIVVVPGAVVPPGGDPPEAVLVEFGQQVELQAMVLDGAECVKFKVEDSYGNVVHTSECITGSDGQVVMSWTPGYDGVFTVYADSYDSSHQQFNSQVVKTITVSPPPTDFQGFITGGGTYDSASARKTFGFVAKVKSNGSVQGSLEFQDHGLGLNFKSLSLDWVYSPNPQDGYFSGLCKLNGAGSYRFYVQVHDRGEPGASDEFLFWVYDESNVLVYVSGGVLDGGNIQIHGH